MASSLISVAGAALALSSCSCGFVRAFVASGPGIGGRVQQLQQQQQQQQQRRCSQMQLRMGIPELDPKRISVLFDFDGTVGDTEQPAMEVAYWELAPYFPASETVPEEQDYVRNNAGKAFEFMLEVVEKAREEAGLPDIATVRASGGEDPKVMEKVNKRRADFGLKPLDSLRGADGSLLDILTMQKTETVEALAAVAQPNPGMVSCLEKLKCMNVPFAIATTSPKPRVPASVEACKLADYFPPDKIHSGESDFDPPRFKPDPSVYLKAAEHEGALAGNCVAVEDSASGVGSAANADIGFIVGYVGASHIIPEVKSSHAEMLMQGERADNGRGCDIVIQDMEDLVPLVSFYCKERALMLEKQSRAALPLSEEVLGELKGNYWLADRPIPPH